MRKLVWIALWAAGCGVERVPEQEYACGSGGPCVTVDAGSSTDARPVGDSGTATGSDAGEVLPDPPRAIDDAVELSVSARVSIPVLANDLGDGLRLVRVAAATLGTAAVEAGAVSFEAGAVPGSERLEYSIEDRLGRTASAAIALTVVRENRRPEAADVSETCFTGERCLVILEGSDPDGDPVSFELNAPPRHGMLAADPSNPHRWIFTPDRGFSGIDDFTFRSSDGLQRSVQRTARLEVIAPPDGWWNSAFARRRSISIAPINGLLVDVPLRISFAAGTIDRRRLLPGAADLIFVDGRTSEPLPHEVEEDPADGSLHAWVRAPVITATPVVIFAYYSSLEPIAVSPPEEVWRTFSSVRHFDGDAADAARRSTPGAAMSVSFEPGLFARAASFGGEGRITLPPEVSPERGTVSLWLRADAAELGPLAALLYAASTATGAHDGFGPEPELHLHLLDGAAGMYAGSGTVAPASLSTTASLADGTWHHLAATWQHGGDLVLYVDGVPAGSAEYEGPDLPPLVELMIGATGSGAAAFAGEVDELRLSPLVRSRPWLRAEHAAMAAPDFVTLGDEEDGS